MPGRHAGRHARTHAGRRQPDCMALQSCASGAYCSLQCSGNGCNELWYTVDPRLHQALLPWLQLRMHLNWTVYVHGDGGFCQCGWQMWLAQALHGADQRQPCGYCVLLAGLVPHQCLTRIGCTYHSSSSNLAAVLVNVFILRAGPDTERAVYR